MPEPSPHNAISAAVELAAALDKLGHEYALGGAIAFGFWGVPRGTNDVDLTLFLDEPTPAECAWVLGELDCNFVASDAMQSLGEHGFCSANYQGVRVDVFLPTIDFYQLAKDRRATVSLQGQQVKVWDAETLCVFKLMFFRAKDMVDASEILRAAPDSFDANWVRKELVDLFGARDPRVARWDELIDEAADEMTRD